MSLHIIIIKAQDRYKLQFQFLYLTITHVSQAIIRVFHICLQYIFGPMQILHNSDRQCDSTFKYPTAEHESALKRLHLE